MLQHPQLAEGWMCAEMTEQTNHELENHSHHLGVPWPQDSSDMFEYSLQLLVQGNLLQDSFEVSTVTNASRY